MRVFILRGLAEGLLGASTVMAHSVNEVFANNPALAAVRDKLVINGNIISGFAPCDG